MLIIPLQQWILDSAIWCYVKYKIRNQDKNTESQSWQNHTLWEAVWIQYKPQTMDYAKYYEKPSWKLWKVKKSQATHLALP